MVSHTSRLQRVVTAVIAVTAAAAIYGSFTFQPLARYFPLFAASALLLLAGTELVFGRRRTKVMLPIVEVVTADPAPEEGIGAIAQPSGRDQALAAGWVVGYPLALLIVGVHAATLLYLAVALRVVGGRRPVAAIAWALGVTAFIHYVGVAFSLVWPAPLIGW